MKQKSKNISEDSSDNKPEDDLENLKVKLEDNTQICSTCNNMNTVKLKSFNHNGILYFCCIKCFNDFNFKKN